MIRPAKTRARQYVKKTAWIAAGILGCFSLGAVIAYNQWWPYQVFQEASLYYTASKSKQSNITYLEQHPEIVHKLQIETLTAGASATISDAQRMSPGLTLVSMGIDAAALVDAEGRVRHTWYYPYDKAWSNPTHIRNPVPGALTFFFDVQAYPNGDLLAVYHAENDTPHGYGMVKIDKDSKLLWKVSAPTHHRIYMAHNGDIYTFKHEYTFEPIDKLMTYNPPILTDSLLILSADGEQKKSIPIIDAFMDTPYEQLLYRSFTDKLAQKGDYTHSNAMMVLEDDMAKAFPMFKPGNVLLSLRSLSTIAVLDTETGKIVWAKQGVWQSQHDAQFQENGNILIFDNMGYPDGLTTKGAKTSRILEFNPLTNAVAWSFSSTPAIPLYSAYRGSVQKLPNGNYLTMETYPGRKVMEIAPDKKLVWRYDLGPDRDDKHISRLFSARRLPPDYFTKTFQEAMH